MVGRAAIGVPAGETAAVGTDVETALPAEDVAVTMTLSECPTSVPAGRYVSRVAPMDHIPDEATNNPDPFFSRHGTKLVGGNELRTED